MKARRKILSRVGWLLTVAAILFPTTNAAAQGGDDSGAAAAMLGGFFLIFAICGLAFYVFTAFAIQTIAKKTNTENAWLAWIPIANLVLLINIARKPIWWIILFLIPIANIVAAVVIGMGVAEARNKPNWWGILMIFPILNFIALGYLAWSD